MHGSDGPPAVDAARTGRSGGSTAVRAACGVVGIACAVAAVVMLTRSSADYLVLLVALIGIVFGSAAVAGRARTAAGVRALTAVGVTLACIVMLGQVGLSMAGMFGHTVPGYSYNSAHRPLTDAGDGGGQEPAPGRATASPSNPAAFTFPTGGKTQSLRSGVKITTALGTGTAPADAQPAKYAGKSVAMVYVRIVNKSERAYTAGYPATYCRYGSGHKCFDVYSESARLTGVEPFNEKVGAGKTATFRLAFAVPKGDIGSFDLRLTLDGAANNPYIVRR